jgi:hypothetical protein
MNQAYKLAYVSGPSHEISSILQRTINDINAVGGQIIHIVQSQSTANAGFTIVTVTIIYTP